MWTFRFRCQIKDAFRNSSLNHNYREAFDLLDFARLKRRLGFAPIDEMEIIHIPPGGPCLKGRISVFDTTGCQFRVKRTAEYLAVTR